MDELTKNVKTYVSIKEEYCEMEDNCMMSALEIEDKKIEELFPKIKKHALFISKRIKTSFGLNYKINYVSKAMMDLLRWTPEEL